jgi:hypothetical protein
MSEHVRRFEDTSVGRVVKMWPLVIAVITVLSWLFSQTYTVASLKESVVDQRKECETVIVPTLNRHDKELALLNEILTSMRDDLKEIKVEMKKR